MDRATEKSLDTVELIYEQFFGLDNINDATTLNVGERGIKLTSAMNVECLRNFTLARRPGYTPVLTGNYTEMWPYGDDILALKNNMDLVRIYGNAASYSYETLMSGFGNLRVVFTDTYRGVYMTNGAFIKVYKTSVEDLPAVTDELKFQMPPGQVIEYWKNSLIVGTGRNIYISDVNEFEKVDSRTGVLAFPSDVTMVKGLTGGLWIGTEDGCWFSKDLGTGDVLGYVGKEGIGEIPFLHQQIIDHSVIKNSAVKVYDITTPTGKIYDEAVIWTSPVGIYIGGKNGEFENLTGDRYEIPATTLATSTFRWDGNLKQYIVILKI